MVCLLLMLKIFVNFFYPLLMIISFNPNEFLFDVSTKLFQDILHQLGYIYLLEKLALKKYNPLFEVGMMQG